MSLVFECPCLGLPSSVAAGLTAFRVQLNAALTAVTALQTIDFASALQSAQSASAFLAAVTSYELDTNGGTASSLSTLLSVTNATTLSTNCSTLQSLTTAVTPAARQALRVATALTPQVLALEGDRLNNAVSAVVAAFYGSDGSFHVACPACAVAALQSLSREVATATAAASQASGFLTVLPSLRGAFAPVDAVVPSVGALAPSLMAVSAAMDGIAASAGTLSLSGLVNPTAVTTAVSTMLGTGRSVVQVLNRAGEVQALLAATNGALVTCLDFVSNVTVNAVPLTYELAEVVGNVTNFGLALQEVRRPRCRAYGARLSASPGFVQLKKRRRETLIRLFELPWVLVDGYLNGSAPC